MPEGVPTLLPLNPSPLLPPPAVSEGVSKVLPALGTLDCVPHPCVPGACLVLQASRLGLVHVLELLGRSPPTTLLRTRMQGWSAILGMGLHLVRGGGGGMLSRDAARL